MPNLVDSQGQPVLDGQGTPVLVSAAEHKPAGIFRRDGPIPLLPEETDPAYQAYLLTLDKNGDGKLDASEMQVFLQDIDHAFRERSKSPRIQMICGLAHTVAIDGKLPDEWLQRIERDNKTRAHKMVEDYLETDTAKALFKNGVASVSDTDLAPIVQYAVGFAKDCAAK